MSSTFFGINVAQTGLGAQRRAMDVLGYNIAHANDPTYKRQRVVMVENAVLAQSQEASANGTSPFGSGVGTGDIERVRDTLIENRLRYSTQNSSKWDFMSKTMVQLETLIGEPSDSGMQADLDNFWNSWQKVASSPESIPIRSALLEDTQALCERMQYLNAQMRSMTDDLNLSAMDKVGQLNLIGQEIAKLNNEIGSLESGQVPVNDLMNRRDALVLELAKLADIQQHGESKDSFVISIGGRVLVQGSKFNALQTTLIAGGNREVEWASDGEKVRLSSGELSAIRELRDVMIPKYVAQLDVVATNLVTEVNKLHAGDPTASPPVVAGNTMLKDALGNPIPGGSFFDPTKLTAGTISLFAGMVDHPELIAASGTGAVGDGDIAIAISNVQNKVVLGGLTINQLYRTMIGDVGGSSAIAQRQASAYGLSMDQFATQQQAVSGVSLDEEMTNMIKFQQAYNASAKVLTAMDELLDVLISIGN